MAEHAHAHDHDHPHAEVGRFERSGYYDVIETALRELLIEKQLFSAGEIRRMPPAGATLSGLAGAAT